MSRRHALACLVILAVCGGLLSGCGPLGARSPREAAIFWARAMLKSDYATIEHLPMANIENRAETVATHAKLGIPADTTDLEAVALAQIDHGTCSLVDIAYRRGGQDLSPHTLLAVGLTEGGWCVLGIPRTATSKQKRLIDPVVIEYLTMLSSTQTTTAALPLSFDATGGDPTVLRKAAFARFATSSMSGFRVESVTGQVVSQDTWFATASVAALQEGRRISFPVELSGRMDGIGNVDTTPGVNGATFGAALR